MKAYTSIPACIGEDDESSVHLVAISADLPKDYSFGLLRAAYRSIQRDVSEMFIAYEQRDWSPTGQRYTTDLKVIAKQLHYGTLTFVIVHATTIDC